MYIYTPHIHTSKHVSSPVTVITKKCSGKYGPFEMFERVRDVVANKI